MNSEEKDSTRSDAGTVVPGRTSPEALRHSIYLSSTYDDLARPRAAVAKAIEQLLGHTVVGMEGYLASDQRPLDRCLSDVASCDYYVGIFAWRYGYVPPGETSSITELEFREAVRSNKPRLIFILDEAAKWQSKLLDPDRGRIQALRDELMATHLVTLFRSLGELPLLVAVAVANQSLIGVTGVRTEAHGELRQGLFKLDQVLLFLAFLPLTATYTHPGMEAPPRPQYGRDHADIDLRDERVIEALQTTSISPSRPLSGPYASPVPFGTDRRHIDDIVSEESRAAEHTLRSALARYSAAELGVKALHATEDVLGHAFLQYLEEIKESAATRRYMEDSAIFPVPILDSGISGGYRGNYLGFLDALDVLRATIMPPV